MIIQRLSDGTKVNHAKREGADVVLNHGERTIPIAEFRKNGGLLSLYDEPATWKTKDGAFLYFEKQPNMVKSEFSGYGSTWNGK